jgi:hypothetical protein
MISEQIPVIELHTLREYVQKIAKEQWTTLKPERMIVRGIVNLPTSSPDVKQIIDWFADKRDLFEMRDLPETFIIKHNMRYILMSSGNPTYAES